MPAGECLFSNDNVFMYLLSAFLISNKAISQDDCIEVF